MNGEKKKKKNKTKQRQALEREMGACYVGGSLCRIRELTFEGENETAMKYKKNETYKQIRRKKKGR